MPDGYINPDALNARPPANLEVEQALLSAILNSVECYEAVAEFLNKEHFADDAHGRIYEACAELAKRNSKISAIVLKNLFDGDGSLEDVGGSNYLADLAANVVTVSTATAKDYGKTILDLYLRRSLINLCMTAAEDAGNVSIDWDARGLVDEVGAALLDLAETGTVEGGPEQLKTMTREAYERAQAARESGGKPTGLQTGLKDLDDITGGFDAPSLVIVAARPSMGKTAFALSISSSVTRARTINPDAGGPVLFFSLEMSGQGLTDRILSTLAGVQLHKMRRGLASNDEMKALEVQVETTKSWPLFIDDSAGLTVQQMHTRARRVKRQQGLALVVIDHLGFVRPSRQQRNKVHEIEDICHETLAMAKSLGVPVLLLSQLNRSVESRDDKRPIMADLRDSGAIEQDADTVIFLYRDEYYVQRAGAGVKPDDSPHKEMEKEAKHRDSLAKCKGIAEIIVAKQRQGPVKTVKAYFNEATMKFDNLSNRRTEQ